MARFAVHAPLNGVAPPLGAALTPTMTRTYAGWSSRGQIFGQPGTMAIPAPDPAAIRDEVVNLAAVGQFYSLETPSVIFPALYWEANDPKERAPVARISDDQMPVPAGRPAGRILFDNYKARHGGQRQVIQPQVVQTWRGMYSR